MALSISPADRLLPSEEAEALLDLTREIADAELAPRVADAEREGRFFREELRTLGKAGLLSLPYPEEWGGGGQPYEVYLQVLEELAGAWLSVGISVSVHSLACFPVAQFGTDEQKQRWLPEMLGGELLGAYCLSEPQSGSDAAALQTRAVALRQLQRADEAIADGRRALELLQAARGEDSAETQRARGALGKSLLLAGRRDEAAPLLRTALARSRALLPVGHADLIEREANVAALEMAYGEYAAARAHFDAALSIAVPGAAPGLPALLEARLGLAELLAQQGEREASRAQAELIRPPMQERPAGDTLRRRWEALSGMTNGS